MAGRYARAKQFNRHPRELRILRTRLGRPIRDIGRKIEGHQDIEAIFALLLARASANQGPATAPARPQAVRTDAASKKDVLLPTRIVRLRNEGSG